ncbi:MAG: MinD/ParA family protein [Methylococcaceae bacterium]|nr:MinD/ParA family protein [Methylococcaceae bacterium]
MQSRRPVRVLAVTSGKGGVGKTNVSVNLGTALAEFGHSVVLLDADMGLANIDVLLGLSPRYNFFHVLEGEKSLDEVMVKGPAGLMVVPGASGIQKMAELTTTEQAAVIRSFSEFDQEIDVLIVDTAAGISSGVVNFAKACQEVVVVVCDEPTSLTDAYAFIKLLNRDHGLCRFQVLTNMMSSAEQGQNLFAKLCKVTDQFLDVNLHFFGSVPEDPYLRKSVRKQAPVVQAYAQSPSAQAFRNLARKIETWPLTNRAGGNLEFFVERMIGMDYLDDEVTV